MEEVFVENQKGTSEVCDATLHQFCLNCGNTLKGKFCEECGQKASTARITFKSIRDELPARLFNYEKGFFFTIIGLVYKPGETIHAYIDGKRMKVVNPLTLIIIVALLSSFIEFFIPFKHKIQFDNEIMMEFIEFLNYDSRIAFLLWIPFMALSTFWVFKKVKLNLTEHFIVNIYILCIFSLVETISLAFLNLNFHLIGIVYSIYCLWAYYDFFKPSYTNSKTLSLSFLAIILMYFIHTIGLIISVLVFVLLRKYHIT